MCAFCIPALPGRPHPAVLLTPFRHLRLRAPFGRRIFPSHPVALSSKLRPRKPFRCNTYGLPASVANKRLTAWLSPLDATLTKNRGYHPSSQKPSSAPSSVSYILTSLLPYFIPSRNGCALPAAMGAAAKRARRLQERRS